MHITRQKRPDLGGNRTQELEAAALPKESYTSGRGEVQQTGDSLFNGRLREVDSIDEWSELRSNLSVAQLHPGADALQLLYFVYIFI